LESYTGKITGRVLAGPDNPGADIWVEAVQDDFKTDPTTAISQLYAREENSRSLTDLEGYFEIDGLAENAVFSLIAERSMGGRVVLEGVKSGSDVEILFETPGSMAGTTVDSQGNAVTQFAIQMVNEKTGQQLNASFNNISGNWEIKNVTAGKVILTAFDSNNNVGTLTRVLAPNETVKDLRLVLSPSKPENGPYAKKSD
jgi:hypothetical protein